MVTGTTLVNGRPDRLERYKSLMGFVPQVGGSCSATPVLLCLLAELQPHFAPPTSNRSASPALPLYPVKG